MSSINKSYVQRLEKLEKQVKHHEDGINNCLDLIEGIHVLLDQKTGTFLTKRKTPEHLRMGRTRKRKSRKKSSKKKKGKSPRRGRTRRQ